MKLLEQKTILVSGIANPCSISYGIVKALTDAGARVIASVSTRHYGKESYCKMLKELNIDKCFYCDVGCEEQIEEMAKNIHEHYKEIDGFIHSIASADRNLLCKDSLHINEYNYCNLYKAFTISAFSFPVMVKHLSIAQVLNYNASLMSISYLGANLAVPNYNVMGPAKAALESFCRYMALDKNLCDRNIRVNIISPGPLKTLSSKAIQGFSNLRNQVQKSSPLQLDLTTKSVGDVALFLCSDMSSNITGHTIYVDNGFNIAPFNMDTKKDNNI